jgi:ABC-type lipoprotein export system ATPase subunit
MISEIDQRLNYINVLLEITQAIQNSTSLEDALVTSVKAAAQVVNVETGTIWFYDKYKTNKIIPVYVLNHTGTFDFTLSPGEGIAGTVIQSGKSEIMLDCASNPRWSEQADKESGFVTRNMICVPLNSKNETLGCIQLMNKLGSDTFTKDDLELCENLASIAAIAIEEKGLIVKSEDNRKVLVSIKNLEKEFASGKGILKVLKNITIDLYENEFVVILGASGSGKTTLLNIIGGMDTATAGSIVVNGTDISKATESKLADYRRNEIGFVFQAYYLLPNLSAKENLNLIAEIAHDPIDTKKALDMVGMRDRARNKPSQLSGGQQQRISIARAVVKKPKLILADEPTAALDFNTSVDVLEVFENIVKQRISTVILITHNSEIAKMADRVIKISDGLIADITVNMRPVKARELKW